MELARVIAGYWFFLANPRQRLFQSAMRIRFVNLFALFLVFVPPAALAAPVVLETAAGEVSFQVELALTPDEQSLGLMNRRVLPEDAGMLFIYPRTGILGFWMKNTLIPLDIIFIGADDRIVYIHENAQPLSLKIISPGRPSYAVLEINGGLSRRKGIKAGDRVRHPLLNAGGNN